MRRFLSMIVLLLVLLFLPSVAGVGFSRILSSGMFATRILSSGSVFSRSLSVVHAQQPSGVAALMQEPSVTRALASAKSTESQTLDDQVRFCETAAPPFNEAARGVLLKRAFTQLGLQNVRVDRAGNVLGDRPGVSARPHVVVAAHLDTVFPPETNVKVKRTGSVLLGPGIGDNCRGLAVLVAIIRSMKVGGVATPGAITFVADVGEEGLGDLRGMRALFEDRSAYTSFVSIDGPGVQITTVAVGSRRYRVTFKGPGGHSFAAFGTPNPADALGRAVAKIAEFQVASEPRTTFNVGRIGGGTSVNAIPSEAWMEVDLRSSDPASLAALDAKFQSAIDAAVVEENARWRRPGVVSASKERVGDRPGGSTPSTSAIVQTALAAARALGLSPSMGEASTDANLPMSLGIPAITIGGGGDGADAHTLTESFDPTDAWKGTQHALLLTIALAR